MSSGIRALDVEAETLRSLFFHGCRLDRPVGRPCLPPVAYAAHAGAGVVRHLDLLRVTSSLVRPAVEPRPFGTAPTAANGIEGGELCTTLDDLIVVPGRCERATCLLADDPNIQIQPAH